MSKRRLVITAVLAGSSQSQVARTYGVSQGWVSRLMARYALEGEAAFEPRSRRPSSTPNATPTETVALVLTLRSELSARGLDAGAETLAWHLAHHHDIPLSRATIHRILTRAGLIAPEPKKRPRSSYLRFQADQPNECWQSDFTHYRLTHLDGRPGSVVEIIAWLDDHSRFLTHISAHRAVTAATVLTTFTQATDLHGYPASTLTDNGMVYTVRLAATGRRGGRNAFEHHLRQHGITQKNGRPGHPTTQGKIERFWQTLKRWLQAQPEQPATLAELDALLTAFAEQYNHHRPHRSLPRRATPAAVYTAGIKAAPGTDRTSDSHDRVRTDRVGTTGTITLRVAGKLRHLAVGRAHTGTHVKVLIHDLDVTVIHATTGEILSEITLDLTRNCQPQRPT